MYQTVFRGSHVYQQQGWMQKTAGKVIRMFSITKRSGTELRAKQIKYSCLSELFTVRIVRFYDGKKKDKRDFFGKNINL